MSISLSARFYGLPKIHKANCPMQPIVSACERSTYNLAKYLTKILKVYIGHTSSFVKDSKDLMDKLKLQDNEELFSFDISALFTSIPVDQALDIINQLIISYQTDMEIKSKVGKAWYEVADHLDREDVMLLLKIVLNNCVFSSRGQSYKQLHGAAMASPCSPVVANIYMEYFEKRASGPELPMSFTIDTWFRYVDDVLTIVKKGTRDSLLNHLNSIDPNIKFPIEPPNGKGAIPFLDTFPRYTHVQVCFKGQNTIKSMLMHPKDKVDPSLKKDIVYQWFCTNPGCKSSYIGETSRSLC